MRSSLSRKLIATTAIVVMGLTPSLVNPAYADTAPQSATSAVADPTPVPAPKEIEVSARGVYPAQYGTILHGSILQQEGAAGDGDRLPSQSGHRFGQP